MGSSRRQRSKQEGTFLESVKVLLQDVKKDLQQLKDKLEELSIERGENVYKYVPMSWEMDSTCWDAWDSAHEFAYSHHQYETKKQSHASANHVYSRHRFGEAVQAQEWDRQVVNSDTLMSYLNPGLQTSEAITRHTFLQHRPATSRESIPACLRDVKLVPTVPQCTTPEFHMLPSVGTWLYLPCPSEAMCVQTEAVRSPVATLAKDVAANEMHGLTSSAESTRAARQVQISVDELPQALDKEMSHKEWSEAETGEYVMRLVSDFRKAKETQTTAQAFEALEEGVRFAAIRCPPSTRRWLFKFLASHQDAGCVRDQYWHNENTSRWWFEGRIICYHCGESDCEDSDLKCCEIRRRDILKVPDPAKRRSKRRNKRS